MLENALLWLGVIIFGTISLGAGFIWLMTNSNEKAARGCIKVRVRNDPAKASVMLVKKTDDDHVSIKLGGMDKVFIIPDNAPYEALWPENAWFKRTQVSIKEIEVDGRNFKPIMLNAPNPKENAGIIGRLCKGTSLKVVMEAWEKYAHQDDAEKKNPMFATIMLIVVAVLLLGVAGYMYYGNTVQLTEIQKIYDGLVQLGVR